MLLYFKIAGEIVIVKIQGHNVTFADVNTNFNQFYPIEAIKLNVQGCLKENPDLEGLSNEEIRLASISRFRDHIKKLNNENSIKDYIVTEMGKIGYSLIKIQREGFRTVTLT